MRTIELPLDTAAQVSPYVWLGLYVLSLLIAFYLMYRLYTTRNPRTYRWKIVDEEGHSTWYVAATPEQAVAKAANDIFGMRAIRMKYFLGQYIEDDNQE